ncbi:LexA family protein [Paenibacillus sp. IHBB 10380]|uniref:LexA family protein n=1 Tax=Paenibacillus sp. IHBB 10380 TaxID=1566358 RepID=UPI000698764A|nr:winged helix DNA-binding protein [Paenibacillus sp. IHBB 10380]
MIIKPLTQRQSEVLDFIKFFIGKEGYPPTVREVAEYMKYQSTSTAFHLIEQLVRKGFVTRGDSARTIRVIDRGELEEPVRKQPGGKYKKERDDALAALAEAQKTIAKLKNENEQLNGEMDGLLLKLEDKSPDAAGYYIEVCRLRKEIKEAYQRMCNNQPLAVGFILSDAFKRD